jgi:hypothetical protein
MKHPASSLLRFAHKTSKKRLQGDFLPCTAKAGRIIGIFAVLMAQKSTSATGCRRACPSIPAGFWNSPVFLMKVKQFHLSGK